MPRFLKSKSAELNDTLAPKRRVNKNLKKTFKGSEQSVVRKDDITSIFEEVYKQLVGIIASMSEINNQLTLSAHTPAGTASRAVDRYVASAGAVLQKVKLLLLFLSRNVPSMTIFDTSQIEALNGLNSQLVSLYQSISSGSAALPSASQNAFRAVLGTFGEDLFTLQQILEGLQAPERGRDTFRPFTAPVKKTKAELAAERREARKAAATATATEAEGETPSPANPFLTPPKPKRGRPKKATAAGGEDVEMMEGMGYGTGGISFAVRPLIGSNPNTWTPAQYRTKVDVGLPMGGYTPTRFL